MSPAGERREVDGGLRRVGVALKRVSRGPSGRINALPFLTQGIGLRPQPWAISPGPLGRLPPVIRCSKDGSFGHSSGLQAPADPLCMDLFAKSMRPERL